MAPASEQELRRLLDALYEAAVDPSHWIDFLSQLTRAARGDSATLVLHDDAVVNPVNQTRAARAKVENGDQKAAVVRC